MLAELFAAAIQCMIGVVDHKRVLEVESWTLLVADSA